MRLIILIAVFAVGLSALSSCNNAPKKDDAFYAMVDSKWDARKTEIMDSMNTACSDRLKNDMKAAVDSVLTNRGIK